MALTYEICKSMGQSRFWGTRRYEFNGFSGWLYEKATRQLGRLGKAIFLPFGGGAEVVERMVGRARTGFDGFARRGTDD